MRSWSTPAWTDPALASRVIERDRSSSEDDESIRFGLFERGTQDPVGCCSVHHFDWGHRRAEVGYILRRSHGGRGMMHEALVAVVDLAFDRLALHRLEAVLDPRHRNPSAWGAESFA